MANFFTFNGISSKTHNLKCKEINHFSFAAKSYESIKVPGRTGNLLIDTGDKENKIVPVIANLDLRKASDKVLVVKNIKVWLQGHTGYKRLLFDDGMEYQAIVNGEVSFTELFKDYYEVSINFECVEVD